MTEYSLDEMKKEMMSISTKHAEELSEFLKKNGITHISYEDLSAEGGRWFTINHTKEVDQIEENLADMVDMFINTLGHLGYFPYNHNDPCAIIKIEYNGIEIEFEPYC